MAQIIVNVWDPTGNMRREVELPDDIPVGRIIPVLTEKMDLPRTDATGQPLYYKFYHVASRKNVLDDQCMQDVGVKINDVLRLQSAPLITRRDGEGAQDPRTSKVLLSYRRDDSVDVTGRMYDRLVTHYGSDQVFKDVDAIPLGVDFRAVLATAVGRCEVLLAVIGRQWLTAIDETGARRLDDPSDFVRIEVETALLRGIPVIPVLVQGAVMPKAAYLPDTLRDLTFRQGMAVRPDPDFHRDVDRLVKQVDALLGRKQTATLPPAPAQPAAPTKEKALSPTGTVRDDTAFGSPGTITRPAVRFTPHFYALRNGLQLIGEKNPSARSVALGFFVRAGSRHETADISGVSHLLQFLAFKGSARRSGFEINRDFDRIGADYNAFTSEENTVFYAAVMPEYLGQVVEILSDILRPTLREDDLAIEKKVVFEAIRMYEEQPMHRAFDGSRRLYFGEHPLGNTILGTMASVGALKRDQVCAYFDHRYIAPNITVALAGSFDWEHFVDLVESHCGNLKTGPIDRQLISERRGSGQFRVMTDAHLRQQHVVQMSPGPSGSAPLRHAATVLSVAVDDETSSRLYWALVDRRVADSADTGYQDYEDTGAFYTAFSCEPQLAQHNLTTVQRLLLEIQHHGITEDELQLAKSKILSRLARASERPKGRMRSLGTGWIYLRNYWSLDDDMRAYDAVTVQSIHELLERYPIDQVTTLALGPLETLAQPLR